jgi:hypothetical protein
MHIVYPRLLISDALSNQATDRMFLRKP